MGTCSPQNSWEWAKKKNRSKLLEKLMGKRINSFVFCSQKMRAQEACKKKKHIFSRLESWIVANPFFFFCIASQLPSSKQKKKLGSATESCTLSIHCSTLPSNTTTSSITPWGELDWYIELSTWWCMQYESYGSWKLVKERLRKPKPFLKTAKKKNHWKKNINFFLLCVLGDEKKQVPSCSVQNQTVLNLCSSVSVSCSM